MYVCELDSKYWLQVFLCEKELFLKKIIIISLLKDFGLFKCSMACLHVGLEIVTGYRLSTIIK